jgi:hypothetical protein
VPYAASECNTPLVDIFQTVIKIPVPRRKKCSSGTDEIGNKLDAEA